MPIVLFRVDERLIHGQVVVGWGSRLHADRIIVVDDELAGSGWEQELYTLGLPASMEAVFVDVETSRATLDGWRADAQRTILLTRDVATMGRIAEAGRLAGADVNIGGIHYSAGRTQVLPYVFLNDEEKKALRLLGEEGAEVSARDVPSARAAGLHVLLGEDRPEE
jgi:mannose/fructose/N-acetylgalactosamine-specific phosphotransferase system component IIB